MDVITLIAKNTGREYFNKLEIGEIIPWNGKRYKLINKYYDEEQDLWKFECQLHNSQ